MAAGLAAAVLAGCGGGASSEATARVDRFDGRHAFEILRHQVALGPRPAGSARSRELARWLRERLPHGRFENLPGGLRNIVGSLPGKGKAVLVGAHYDTKLLPGFVGAEDGAGGTAAVLELARALRRLGRPAGAPPIRFVLFDGEECNPPGEERDFYRCGLIGSRAYASRHASELRAAVVLDFVAQKDLSIPRDATSDVRIWADLRAAAKRVGSGSVFPDDEQGPVLDDHSPFLRAGVPAVDLIDFTFPCWHKTCDDLSAVSERSLDRSGEAVLELLRTWR